MNYLRVSLVQNAPGGTELDSVPRTASEGAVAPAERTRPADSRRLDPHAPNQVLFDVPVPELEVLLQLSDPRHIRQAIAQVLAQAPDATEGLPPCLGDAQTSNPGPDAPAKPKRIDRLLVKSGGRLIVLRLPEVDWIGAADNYALIHCGALVHRLRRTINRLEAELPPDQFLRVSRFAIVNRERIKAIERCAAGERRIVLLDGTSIPLHRGYRKTLQRLGRS